jgi:hypothetical protein
METRLIVLVALRVALGALVASDELSEMASLRGGRFAPGVAPLR